ncbi:hypothetical protein SSS_10121 [Sarcoptes scabiei]|nr:hypothetical protein SSS_10121 [Sarcoptes scabiei]
MLSSEQPHPYLYPQQRNEQCQSSRSLSPTTSSSSSKSLTNASRYHHQQLSTTLIGSKPDVVDPSSSSSSPAFAFSAPYERLAKFRNPPWWNRRTRLERFLCALTAVTMATCVAMCITLAMVQLRPLDPFSTRGSSDLSSSSAQLLVDGRSSVIGPAATRNRVFKSGKSMKDYDDFSQHQDSHDKLNEDGYEDIVHAGDGKFKTLSA